MLALRRRRITVDQYFAEVGETEERYELIDGEIYHMAGGTREHAAVSRRITSALDRKLAGTPCEPFGSDMGLRLDAHNFRYPDVAIYCDPRDTGPEAAKQHLLRFPKVVFEVLSPSTAQFDRARKVAEYKMVPSIATIVLVDADAQGLERYDRAGDGSWTYTPLHQALPLILSDPAVTLTPTEIFGAA